MGTGIRAELRVDPGGTCLVARTTERTGTTSRTVQRSVAGGDRGTTAVEFMLDDGSLSEDTATTLPEGVTPVFDYGATTVYRYTRSAEPTCPCDCIESHGCPIADRHVDEGAVFLTFHAPDVETLQALVADLRDQFPEVDIQRLLRSEGEGTDHDLVFVDRGALTDRQHEALRCAHELGYFDRPKGANASEVAAAMDITRPTFTEHLAAAQSKLLDAVLRV